MVSTGDEDIEDDLEGEIYRTETIGARPNK